ncbi:23S rRNA (pseudouridine(1915)-N(3))-methyltransferase RlmH [sulfur-oxidizing endosymbiont of Gigantopelta aegis]|uniref:23S rRNA (pseudouridine(1915)-N(3))-methyltransferase RlmH n=1 Tax=sulfur-oxidizing endosymbiont of Gigantopelta aegis TaxID=2794934 RepID=UPI0018DC473C|nr:23S rRNA (pseudouridine(1915)-N(3))-methyltransferase RlmH [sulfur-oxidizing endosymbiont of Gigantopelta aegis]
MNIYLLAVGNKMPDWVTKGYNEYAKRLNGDCHLKLVEIAPGKRGKNADLVRIKKAEGDKLLDAIPKGCLVIALEVLGKVWSTEKLSQQMDTWLHSGQDVALLIGGPEGLSEACVARADIKWSLSSLTLPHPLVRVLLSEQLYRAYSILKNHPYHR